MFEVRKNCERRSHLSKIKLFIRLFLLQSITFFYSSTHTCYSNFHSVRFYVVSFFSFFLCNTRSSSALSFFHASPSPIFKPLNVLKREGSVVVPVFSVPRLFHSPDQGTISILRYVLANFSVPLAQRNAPDARPRTLELEDFVWFRDTVIIKEA